MHSSIHTYVCMYDVGWGISPLFMCTNLVSEPRFWLGDEGGQQVTGRQKLE